MIVMQHRAVCRLRLHAIALALGLAVSFASAASQYGVVRRSDGETPTIYLALLICLAAALVGAAAAAIQADRLIRAWTSRPRRAFESWMGVLVVSGCLAGALLVRQIEDWLMPGSRAASLGVLAAAVAVMSFVRLDRILRRQGQAALRLGWRFVGDPVSLALTVVVGAWAVQVVYLASSMPLMCDEASTFMLFGHGLYDALTRFDTPNNHVLNSALAVLSTTALGDSAMAIRLPAVLAGIGTIPALFMAGSRLFDRRVALVACVLAASSTWLTYHAFQARGYAFVVPLALLSVWALSRTLAAVSSERHWGVLIACLSLAFAALVTTIYLWLSILVFALSVTLTRPAMGDEYHKWLKGALASLILVGLFAVVVYANPAFFLLRTGRLSGSVFAFPERQPTSLAELLRWVVQYAMAGGAEVVNASRLAPMTALLTLGLLCGVGRLVYRRSGLASGLLACLFVVPLLAIAWQANTPYPRNLLYLVPFVHIVAASGLLALAGAVTAVIRRGRERRISRSQADALVAAAAIGLFLLTFPESTRALGGGLRSYHAERWPAGAIAGYLEDRVRPGDAVVADTCLEYMVAYQLAPRLNVTTVFELWREGAPHAARIYALPAKVDVDPGMERLRRFLQQACAGRTAVSAVARFGQQDVYLCE